MGTKISEPIIVLAGGFGTRLKSVVSDVPKPLAPVNGRTFLDFLMDSLKDQGATRVILSLHYLPELVMQHFEMRKGEWPFPIEFCVEPKPLGTGGAIKFVAKEKNLTNAVWITNGDTWMENGLFQINEMLTPELRQQDWIGVRWVENANRYGRVMFDSTGRVESFIDRKEDDESGWIHAGISYVQVSELLKIEKESFSLEKEYFSQELAKQNLFAAQLKGDFIDIGTPEDYARFQQLVSHGKRSASKKPRDQLS